jgi:two-component system, NarL family, sensor kinase
VDACFSAASLSQVLDFAYRRDIAILHEGSPMFKLLRYYAAASLVAVLAAAVLLTWFYRQVAIEGIVQLGERSNTNLAQIVMNPIKPGLLAFLDTAADFRPGSTSAPLPAELARSIATVMEEDNSIARIKIYNRLGVVVFSTNPSQVGDDQGLNEGFITAIRGGVGNELIYRDSFNTFDGATEEDNLMQTYLPVRAGPAEPVRGVFEIYADVNGMVHQAERAEFIILAGALLIMSALYAVLLLVVRHANKTIERQQSTITERNETLTLLADQMLKSEDSHKQKIALELHEGVAQTLAAVKLKAESSRRDRRTDDEAASTGDSMIPMLQEAIEDVRAIATDLRPASLDDLGLLPTVHWLCREFELRHPGIRIERRIALHEHDIPPRLKGILYGIVMSVLGDIAHHTKAARVRVGMALDNDVLVLLIDESGEALGGKHSLRADGEPQARAGRMKALTTLSGGEFTAASRSEGGATLRAVWNRGSIEAEESPVIRRFESA